MHVRVPCILLLQTTQLLPVLNKKPAKTEYYSGGWSQPQGTRTTRLFISPLSHIGLPCSRLAPLQLLLLLVDGSGVATSTADSVARKFAWQMDQRI